MPATPTRWTSSTSWSPRSTGSSGCPPGERPRSSSPTTTPTAGTTTYAADRHPVDDPAEDALTGPGPCGTAAPGAYQDRCGYGPRLPLLVISPWAKRNSVDHAITDQTSILRFVEDNWSLGRIGNQSFDAKAGSLDGMFAFNGRPHTQRLILNLVTGEVVRH